MGTIRVMRARFMPSIALLIGLLAVGCRQEPSGGREGNPATHDLVGQWRAKIQFRTGTFAAVKDLEFMYVFNSGGTMTESSNYDAAPPVPPAYGIWRRTGSNRFEAKYEFYMTRPPTGLEQITKGGGWLPSGRGVLMESITVSDDGETFTSTIRFQALDPMGKPIEGGGDADGRGTRITWPP